MVAVLCNVFSLSSLFYWNIDVKRDDPDASLTLVISTGIKTFIVRNIDTSRQSDPVKVSQGICM